MGKHMICGCQERNDVLFAGKLCSTVQVHKAHNSVHEH